MTAKPSIEKTETGYQNPQPTGCPLQTPGSALTALIGIAPCAAGGDECICRNSAGVSGFLRKNWRGDLPIQWRGAMSLTRLVPTARTSSSANPVLSR